MADKGEAFALKISDGSGGFNFFAGLTGKGITINNEFVDTTIPDNANPEKVASVRSLHRTRSVELTGDFRAEGDAAEKRLVAAANSDTDASDTFQVIHPKLGTWEGVFNIPSLQLGDDGATTGSMTLQSNGPITYTAPAAS